MKCYRCQSENVEEIKDVSILDIQAEYRCNNCGKYFGEIISSDISHNRIQHFLNNLKLSDVLYNEEELNRQIDLAFSRYRGEMLHLYNIKHI